jgi:hypothetical protein
MSGNPVCGDHWHGLSGQPVDGSEDCPWCIAADREAELAKAESRIAELEREMGDERLIVKAARDIAKSVGWRGDGPNSKDEFYCEVCSQHHEDFNLIPHRTEVGAECPIGQLRAAICSYDAARAAEEDR